MRADRARRLFELFWRRRILLLSCVIILSVLAWAFWACPLAAGIAFLFILAGFAVFIGTRDLDRPYLGPGRGMVDFREAFGPGRFKSFAFDMHGVPMHPDQEGRPRYFPTFVGWYAIACYQRHLDGDEAALSQFKSQIGWLQKNAKHVSIRGEDAAVWHFGFGWKESNAVLRKPWISGLGQAAAISALVRAHGLKIGDDPLGLARKAAVVYKYGVDEGGVAFAEDGCTYFEEYPAKPYSKVLDGFVFAVLALHDLWKSTGDNAYRDLFRKGISTLEKNISDWDYRKRWSMYGIHGLLCDDDYNKLNSSQLGVLYELTGKQVFRRYHLLWRPDRKGFFQKIGIILVREQKRLAYVWRNLRTGGNF